MWWHRSLPKPGSEPLPPSARMTGLDLNSTCGLDFLGQVRRCRKNEAGLQSSDPWAEVIGIPAQVGECSEKDVATRGSFGLCGCCPTFPRLGSFGGLTVGSAWFCVTGQASVPDRPCCVENVAMHRDPLLTTGLVRVPLQENLLDFGCATCVCSVSPASGNKYGKTRLAVWHLLLPSSDFLQARKCNAMNFAIALGHWARLCV